MDNIREGVQKPWAKVLIFAIVISFVGAGYFSSSLFLGNPNAVAMVNDEMIIRSEFQQAYSNMRQRYGDAYTQFIKTEQQEKNFRLNVLQNLIDRKLVLQSIDQMGIKASENSIRKEIIKIPSLHEKGVFSSKKLSQALANVGLSHSQFKQSLEDDHVLNQLNEALSKTEFVLENEWIEHYKIIGEKRTGRALTVKNADFLSTEKISDEAILKYYESHQSNYRDEESVTLEYIELSIEALQKIIEIDNDKIKAYYQENNHLYKEKSQKKIAHILIKNASDAEKKIKMIQKKMNQGFDFFELAKKESEDSFSAKNGGDLGFLESGTMEPSFEKAVSMLNKIDDISTIIKTSFGYHLIKLTAITPESIEAFKNVKEKIKEVLKKQEADELFYQYAETLEESVFEISDSLEDAAKKLKIPVKTTESFTRRTAKNIFSNPEVIKEVFSEHIIVDELNSKPITITEQHLLVIRMKKHKPESIKPLKMVKSDIILDKQRELSKNKAKKWMNTIEEGLKNNKPVVHLLSERKLNWKPLKTVTRTDTSLPYQVMNHFFKMPYFNQIVYKIVPHFDGYTLLTLESIQKGNINSAKDLMKEREKTNITRFYSSTAYRSLLNHLKKSADIIKYTDNISR
jgi:peptidyl-prolyl cis-trans isomerase D